MKTLFFLVSIVAVSYLALQTTLVNSYVASFKNAFDPLMENEQEKTNNIDYYSALNAKIINMGKHSDEQKRAFALRIDELENNIEMLTSAMKNMDDKKLIHSALENSATPILVEAKSIETKTDIATNLSEGVAQLSTNSSIKSALSTSEEQQKRAQQQAVLRVLSQKMELAALDSLVKSRPVN